MRNPRLTSLLIGGLGLLPLAAGTIRNQTSGPPGSYPEIARAIRSEGLRSEKAYDLLAALTRAAGPRLTGSPAAAAAVDHMRRVLEELGFETWLEPVMVQHWVRGEEEAAIVGGSGTGDLPLTITALGWSVSTPPAGITAPVVEIRSDKELAERAEAVRGAIVFFNSPMDRTSLDSFRAYGEAARYRTGGASAAAKAGALGVLVRSVTQRLDDYPHAGMVGYDPEIQKIPAAAISTLDAELLSSRLKIDSNLRVRLRLSCATLDPVSSANVVGQIRGAEKPEDIILIGGHLDSWDLAVGAHDDGAGCVQAVEALRLIREAGLRPKRTIRAVLFMNEEFGSSGGRDYAADPRRKGETHLVAMESDRGGFIPIGFGVGGPPEVLKKYKAYEELLQSLGIQWVRAGGGGSDIGPLVRQGAVPMGFVPDAQRYFDIHHSGLDTLESVNPRELELGAIVLAMMSYIASQEGI